MTGFLKSFRCSVPFVALGGSGAEEPHYTGSIELNKKISGRSWASEVSAIFLRLALGAAFLSAVADRFGWWGAYGQPNVAWGDFARFVAYTGKLNWFAPAALVLALAWAATVAEIVLGLALILGVFTRVAAFLSGLLLLFFALSMTFSLGVKAPLNFSVFSASAGAFLLAAYRNTPISVDAWRFNKRLP